jgi:hypothetical protein
MEVRRPRSTGVRRTALYGPSDWGCKSDGQSCKHLIIGLGMNASHANTIESVKLIPFKYTEYYSRI